MWSMWNLNRMTSDWAWWFDDLRNMKYLPYEKKLEYLFVFNLFYLFARHWWCQYYFRSMHHANYSNCIRCSTVASRLCLVRPHQADHWSLQSDVCLSKCAADRSNSHSMAPNHIWTIAHYANWSIAAFEVYAKSPLRNRNWYILRMDVYELKCELKMWCVWWNIIRMTEKTSGVSWP